MVLANSEVDKS